MNGKSKCKILKGIRKQIADENDIAFVTSECKYQGDCTGTCPKCEAELQYLESELRKRQNAGKAIAVAGIAATMLVAATACGPTSQPLNGDVPYQDTSSTAPSVSDKADMGEIEKPTDIELEGDIVIPPDDDLFDDEVGGVPPVESEPDDNPFSEKEPIIDDGDWGALH